VIKDHGADLYGRVEIFRDRHTATTDEAEVSASLHRESFPSKRFEARLEQQPHLQALDSA
jgi:hypothetical protein